VQSWFRGFSPEEVNGEPEWEVERIKRKGCDPDDNWYPAANFKNAPIALEKFHDKHPSIPGPPARLRDWIRAAAADGIDGDHLEDNTAEGMK